MGHGHVAGLGALQLFLFLRGSESPCAWRVPWFCTEQRGVLPPQRARVEDPGPLQPVGSWVTSEWVSRPASVWPAFPDIHRDELFTCTGRTLEDVSGQWGGRSPGHTQGARRRGLSQRPRPPPAADGSSAPALRRQPPSGPECPSTSREMGLSLHLAKTQAVTPASHRNAFLEPAWGRGGGCPSPSPRAHQSPFLTLPQTQPPPGNPAAAQHWAGPSRERQQDLQYFSTDPVPRSAVARQS